MLITSLRPTGRKEYKERNTREGKSFTSTEGSAKRALPYLKRIQYMPITRFELVTFRV